MRLFILLAAVFLLAADWPQFLGPKRDGSSLETGLARQWPAEGPKRLWQKKAGAGWSGPVVLGDRAILFHRQENDEVVECVDAATGKPIWQHGYRTRYIDEFNFDDGPRSTPLIAHGRVFTLGADGDLTALQLKTGERVWQRNLNRDYKPPKGFFGVGTSPMIAAGRLLINVGAKGAGVVAFDLDNGQEIWKATDQGVSYSSPVAASLGGKDAAVFFTRQGLLVLDPQNGAVRYEYPWRPRLNASVNAASPVVSANRIFLSTSYSQGAVLLELAADSLKEVWSNDRSLSCHFNTPLLIDDHLYGINGRQEGKPDLRCVEWKTGKLIWAQEGFGCAALLSADGLILALAESGDLVLFEPAPGEYKEVARAHLLGDKVRAVPALANGRFYARDRERWVCYELKK